MRTLLLFLILLAAPLQAAKIRYIDLHSYTKKELREAIAGRLDYIRKRSASPSRADDAAFLVETYLRNHGLPDATVSWNLGPEKDIILTINEGIAKFLGPITVQGYSSAQENQEDIIAIQNQFKAPFPESGDKRAFSAEAIATANSRVTALLHSYGYWNATLTSQKGTRDPQGHIPFTLQIDKGPLFTLLTPELKSPVPPTTSLRQKLQNTLNQRATSKTIIGIRNSISESYRRLGYNDIRLEIEKEAKGSQLLLTFTLTPGEKYTIHSFATSGLKRDIPPRVLSRFTKKIGESYDLKILNQEIKKLLSTGAFNSVRLENKEHSPTELDLTLHLSEAKARGYSLALGFGSIEGYILGTRYHDRNFMGHLWNLTAGIEATSLGVLGEIALTDPFFLGKDLSLNNRGFLITRDFDSHRKLEGGITNELSWKIGPHYSATLGLENSLSDISSDLPDELIGPKRYFNHRLNLRQTYDRRNDPTLPTDGWFARFDTSLGYIHGDQALSYLETEAQLSYYRSLGDNTSYSLGLRGGFILSDGADEDIPIDLRTFLGGANSVRSFPERDLGERIGSLPLGGTSWWVANAEYSHTIKGPLRGLIFLDAGALDNELELAAGLGIRINLPVGPIRLEYGRSLSRDSGEPSGAFHFAIGTTF